MFHVKCKIKILFIGKSLHKLCVQRYNIFKNEMKSSNEKLDYINAKLMKLISFQPKQIPLALKLNQFSSSSIALIYC